MDIVSKEMPEFVDSIKIEQIEKKLKNVLAPVNPDPGFVQMLQERLKKKSEIYLENNDPIFYFLVVILGVILAIMGYLIAMRKKK